jgi:magnesium transporter
MHQLLNGLTNVISLLGVVLFGSLAGTILPLVLQRLGFDPARVSVVSVATLVYVTGIIIYFTIAAAMLQGSFL